MMKKLTLAISATLFSGLCFAQNPLSVHVLNLENGLPSSNVKVILEAQQKDKWVKINEGSTDSNGRISSLYPENKVLDKGVYKVTFQTGEWFKQNNQRAFFPEVFGGNRACCHGVYFGSSITSKSPRKRPSCSSFFTSAVAVATSIFS